MKNSPVRASLLCALAALAVVIADPAGAGVIPTTPGVHQLSVRVGALTRWYLLVVPPTYAPPNPSPLLLVFHGGGSSARNMLNDRQDLVRLAAQRRMVLGFANGFNTSGSRNGPSTWNAVHCCGLAYRAQVDDVAFARAIVTEVGAGLHIDPKRIYATGFSNGAGLTHRLGADLPDVFAAIAVASGTPGGSAGPGVATVAINPRLPLPVMMLHGRGDPKNPIAGGLSGEAVDLSLFVAEAIWVRAGGCQTMPIRQTLPAANGPVVTRRYGGCQGGAEVVTVIGNYRHAWPSPDKLGIDGNRLIVEFLLRHVKH